MFKPKAEIKIIEFTNHINSLIPFAHTKIVDGFDKNQKELLKRYIKDTKDLIGYNECVIGLENLLQNIYEIDFKIDEKAIELAKKAIELCGFEYEKWKFIEELDQVSKQKKIKIPWKPQKGEKPKVSGKKKFQSCWTSTQQNKIYTKLIANEKIDVNHNNDFLDLRGFPFKSSNRAVTLKNTDLSYAKLEGKLNLESCLLNFAESDFPPISIQSMQNCLWKAGRVSIKLDITYSKDFLFTDNNFSYSTIQNMFLTARLNGIQIKNCTFDFCVFKSDISFLHFVNCSFVNTNFNNILLSKSVFENCIYDGASFDNTIYDNATFLNCKGLNKSKMMEHTRVYHGIQISNEEHIIIK